MEPKSNLIELSMPLKYGLTDVIGHKTMEIGAKTLINHVWCKACAKFKTQTESSSNAKGSAKTSALALSMVQTLSQNIRYEFIFCYLYLFSI